MTLSNNKSPAANDIYTISRLNREVRTVLEDVFPTVWVQGEVSNLAKPASGHLYFSLKDNAAQVRCAMFKNRQSGLRFEPENGMQVMARANVGLYEGRGEFQLIIQSLEPAGAGALQLAFEALKQKLSDEGLFDEKHKKRLPRFPENIGIITSATGAAVRDILSILNRRYPSGNIIIYPTMVQGDGAGQEIAKAIKLAEQRKECDVLILARGGGSIEDLWAFNEEVVARTIFNITTPIVSGVGHEIDFTIADFVADQRSATPSAAAELISPDSDEILTKLKHINEQLIRSQKQTIHNFQNQVTLLSKHLPHPKQRLMELIQRTDEYSMRLKHHAEKQIATKRFMLSEIVGKVNNLNPAQTIARQLEKVNVLQKQFIYSINRTLEKAEDEVSNLGQLLKTVSPVSTLERGYAIVTDQKTSKIITNSSNLNSGDKLRIRLAAAEIDSTVDAIHEK
ncbi:MAG: exodeoxyribonuclease VII large subunit [Proteobacteria bacterium]|nr:exodeoxyribonuclease VII large subunit [Pseudomonadota bacterium]NOG60301.1 exodeoxyribonuclease VII large subunit [Pseudomonadota bacterium]